MFATQYFASTTCHEIINPALGEVFPFPALPAPFWAYRLRLELLWHTLMLGQPGCTGNHFSDLLLAIVEACFFGGEGEAGTVKNASQVLDQHHSMLAKKNFMQDTSPNTFGRPDRVKHLLVDRDSTNLRPCQRKMKHARLS